MNPTASLLRRALNTTMIVAVAIPFAVIAPTSASAAPRAVDPATLTPPPPDFFDATCRAAGQQIQCDLAFVDPISPVEEPIGITCGSGTGQFDVLDTWTRRVKGTRRYSPDGLLLRRHFTDEVDGRLTNSVTGATVGYRQHNTFLHDLSVPGDATSGNLQRTTHLRLVTAHGSMVIESGRLVTAVVDDTLLFRSGKHPFDDYFAGDLTALQPLCDALA